MCATIVSSKSWRLHRWSERVALPKYSEIMCRSERCAGAARNAGERPPVSGWNESRKRSVRAVPREARSNEMAFPATEHSEQRHMISLELFVGAYCRQHSLLRLIHLADLQLIHVL